MNRLARELVLKVSNAMLSEQERATFEKLADKWRKLDTGFGYDMFGAEYESIVLFYSFMKIIYERYFRVESSGHENIPAEGPLIFASNHSGVVPIDGVMIPIDLIKNLDPPRIIRPIIEIAFSKLPFSAYMMNRFGHIVGIKRNFDEVLKMGQAILVFPEGIRGMGKRFTQRYKLTPFNVGHVELSIANRAPIVPVGLVGAEEQMPVIYNWERMGQVFGVNAFPITLTWPFLGPIGLIPLPTKYHIYYGEPFRFWEEDPDAPGKAEVIHEMARRVQASVQKMLDEGRQRRSGIFF